MCTPWMTIKISVVHYTNNLFKTYLILLNVYVLYSCALYSYTLHSFNYLGKDNLLTSWVLMLILSWLNAQKVAYHFDPLGPEGQGTGRFGRVFFRRETCGWSVITVTWPSPFKGKHTGAKKKCGWIPLDTLGGKFSNLKKNTQTKRTRRFYAKTGSLRSRRKLWDDECCLYNLTKSRSSAVDLSSIRRSWELFKLIKMRSVQWEFTVKARRVVEVMVGLLHGYSLIRFRFRRSIL